MSVGNVWLLVLGAVLVAAVVSSKPDHHGIESRTKEQRFRRLFRGGAPAVPPFFAGNQRPKGLPDIARGKEILQTLTGSPKVYFVSLFDPDENTPFYSAYKVTPADAVNLGSFGRGDINTKPKDWRNPPGVAGVNNAYHTAISTDGQPLSRGHMNPLGLNTFDKSSMQATFTLTNAVPQFEASNSDYWEKFENRIRDYAKNTCAPRGGTLYLLTGKSNYGLKVDARGETVQDTLIPLPYQRHAFPGGVTLVTPRAVWTAGCCVWTEPGIIYGTRSKAESFAVMSNNQRNAGLLYQKVMSVTDLEELLRDPTSWLWQGVNLFPGNSNCRGSNIAAL